MTSPAVVARLREAELERRARPVSSIGTRYTVVVVPGGVRLTAEPGGVIDLTHTDAEALGSALKAVAREKRDPDPLARMRSDRDALTAAINILHRPLDNA